MASLYTPLEILKQIQLPEGTKMKAKDPLLAGFVSGDQDAVDLDDFLNWVLGKTFCKAGYNGPYQELNRLLLRHYHTKEEPAGRTYREARNQYRGTSSIRAILTCWKKYKQVYRFDPEFTRELMETTAVRLPLEVLRRLPFRCYYLDLEETADFQPTMGLFVYCGFEQETGTPNLGVLQVLPPEPGDDQCRLHPILFSGRDLKRQGLLETKDGTITLSFRQSHPEDEKQNLLLFLLQGMLYLSSHEPDIMESPKKRVVNVGKAKAGNREKPVVLTDVGVRYGNVIRKRKKDAVTIYVGNGAPRPKRQITSHMRSAHWHHYWTGKGRTKRIVKWIPPTFVSGSGKELPVTIHKVKK